MNTRPQKRVSKGKSVRDLSKGRICSACEIYKDREHFYVHVRGFNGLGSKCKECIHKNSISENTKKNKKYFYDNRRKNKQCVKCGSTDLVTGVHCRKCWFIDRATYRAGGVHNLQTILELWEEQNGKCFYTDRELVPGDNASIDHQIPISRGGKNTKENLRWVCCDINVTKSTMTHNEFIKICNYISEKFKHIPLNEELSLPYQYTFNNK